MTEENDHGRVKITYYTHPFCVDSWRMQGNWEAFLCKVRSQISYHVCMVEPAVTPENAVLISATTMAGRHRACQAVKAASLQSQVAADTFLRILRVSLLIEGRDICQTEVLMSIARQVSKEHRAEFDYDRFGRDFLGKFSRNALINDLNKFCLNRIDRCPTITLTVGGKGSKLIGFQSLERLSNTFQDVLMKCGQLA